MLSSSSPPFLEVPSFNARKAPATSKSDANASILSATMNALIPKSRRPKFELNLKIYDLNNVPLVSGTSLVKWHLSSSTSAEHRGRTPKSPIKDHKVTWDYSRSITVRLTIDKSNMLQECTIRFDVIQEYNTGGRSEKITLGHVELNLAEYVELHEEGGEAGITRRYLMQDSKINSTLKLGIAMRQLDGERNFITPPLKTASVFGGIAGIIEFEQSKQDDIEHMPTINRSREAGELQDMYRRALAASWGAQAGELPPDQCIEDIFAGGDGWTTSNTTINENTSPTAIPNRTGTPRAASSQTQGIAAISDDEDYEQVMEMKRHHRRTHSGGSTRSMTSLATVTGKSFGLSAGGGGTLQAQAHGPGFGLTGHDLGRRHAVGQQQQRGSHKYSKSRDGADIERGRDLSSLGGGGMGREALGAHHRTNSKSSLDSRQDTQGGSSSENSSERGRYGFKRAREVDEFSVREDLVAWRLPGTLGAAGSVR